MIRKDFTLTEAEKGLDGRELIPKVIDPIIEDFVVHFRQLAGTDLLKHEREVLRAFLYYTMVNNG